MQLKMLITGSGRFQVAVLNKSRAEDPWDGNGINYPPFIFLPPVAVPYLPRQNVETGFELDSHRIAKG